jgi:hypothetical protein
MSTIRNLFNIIMLKIFKNKLYLTKNYKWETFVCNFLKIMIFKIKKVNMSLMLL